MVDPLPYATYSFVMSITPGPNNVMLTAAGATFGFRRTLPHMVGISTGVAIQTIAVCAGLGALFAQWPQVQTLLRWAGALYLIYMGWRMLGLDLPGRRTRGAAVPHGADAPLASAGANETRAPHGQTLRPVTFTEAALFQFLNPKAWIMTLTAATLFLPRDLGPLPANAYMAAVMVGVGLPCIAVWALFGSSLRTLLARPASRVAFNAVMALALAATGVMMVV
jgi:threonine/homoserine/homoserine lactone efflux protein